GMAKGAGMIEPNMATMLAFLTSDAAVDPEALQNCLGQAVSQSFNKISVDGDQSTNDTVLFMANGAAGNSVLDENHPNWNSFTEAVNEAAKQLALKIVEDGEGATKFVAVTVSGAVSYDDAQKAVRAIANSMLVKTSWYGEDPNWGRVIDAVGYSGADVREDLVDINYDDVCAVKNGQTAKNTSVKDLEKVLAQKCFTVNVNLNLGEETDTVYTCDCSEEYVRINSEYMT
ncbi:bifunctional ornithine acetyltransferase/N-acetylglutamate synthase, partial [Verrucomicrobiota bacterium]